MLPLHFILLNFISESIVITLKPDGANGTSKFIEIGGRVHFFFVSVSNNSISADSWVSFIPAIRLILDDEIKLVICIEIQYQIN